MESEKTPEKIDLIRYVNRFFKAFGKLWLVVLLLTALGAGANYIWARSSFIPMYESKAIFSVSSGYAVDDIFLNSYYYDTLAANQMVSSFPSMLSTDIMRDLMMEYLGTNYINGNISASSVAETNLFELKVSSNDPQDAYDILCAVIECYPQAMVYTLDNPQLIIRQNPTLPESPVNSFDPVRPMAMGAALGLVLGLALVALQAFLSRTVDSADELKKLINLPLLASFPHVIQKKRRKSKHTFINADDDEGLSEALRGLRTKIHKQLSDREGKVVLLTSTVPSEGKSTISANLALSLAAEGNRVVLVDADLRNQTIYRMFGSGKARVGLMGCMKNAKQNVLDALSSVPGTNLHYLSGESTDKRHYSIDTKAMRRVLDALSPEFDYIVIDSPPCSIVSDTALLARFADCVLYVVKQNHASEHQILDAVTGLYERDIPLTGCILNDVPHRRIHYGYGYGYGFGYGYGYGYGKKYGYGQKKK